MQHDHHHNQGDHGANGHDPHHSPRSHASTHAGHGNHAGHDPRIFKRRFFICLLLMLPILYFASHFQNWFGYQAIQFPGAQWVSPILSAIIYFYGGWVFLRGAWGELHSKIGMMTLVALAITVAFVYSVAVSLGLEGEPFYWELATLVDIMLLGHWIEMASVQGASRALENLAELVPAVAHRLSQGQSEDVPVGELRQGDRILIRPGDRCRSMGPSSKGHPASTKHSSPENRAPFSSRLEMRWWRVRSTARGR